MTIGSRLGLNLSIALVPLIACCCALNALLAGAQADEPNSNSDKPIEGHAVLNQVVPPSPDTEIPPLPSNVSGGASTSAMDGHADAHSPLRGKVGRDEIRKHHHKLTAEDYREMNYGVLGIITSRFVFSKSPTVTMVLPGCPAALGGIKIGDVEIKVNGHMMDDKLGQKETWHICDGKAGTPVDMTVKRKGQFITFHLVRMNIEDIQNSRVRKMFEKMLRDFGPPEGE